MSHIAWIYPRRGFRIYGRSCELFAPVPGASALSRSRGKASSKRSGPCYPCPCLRSKWPNRPGKGLCLCLSDLGISSQGIGGISCNAYAGICCISFPRQKSLRSDGRCGVHASGFFSQSFRRRLGPVASIHPVPTSGRIWRRASELSLPELRGWRRQFGRVDDW